MIELPDSPAPANVIPGLLYFGSTITPPLGGATQTIERLGTRYKIKVSMPPLPNQATALAFLSKLRRAKSEGIRMAWPLGGFQPGDPGPNPRVRFFAYSGRAMRLTGLNDGYEIKEGQFFSVVSDGQNYLYEVTETVVVGSSGEQDISVFPLIRATHAPADPVHISRPVIEGIVHGQDFDWELSVEHLNSFEFEIHERK